MCHSNSSSTSISTSISPLKMTSQPTLPPLPPPSTTTTTAKPTTTPLPPTSSTFTFPPSHSFPPLYTLQPNPTTLTAQLQKWSRIILLYTAHHRIFRLALPASLSLPLFKNVAIKRRLDEPTLRVVLNYMASEEGGFRVEWITEKGGGGGGGGGGGKGGEGRNRCFVFWKRPEEWADLIWEWVERAGLRGGVVTVWEMVEGEGGRGEEFGGMDGEVLARALGVLVKRGRAQVFGEDEGRGVKFF